MGGSRLFRDRTARCGRPDDRNNDAVGYGWLIVESAMFPGGVLMNTDADRRGVREKNDESGKEVERESVNVWGTWLPAGPIT